MTYQATTGAGNYGSLTELETAGLVDSVLGGTVKSGYTFSISVAASGTGTPAVFASTAVPVTSTGITATGTRAFGIATQGVVVSGAPAGVTHAAGVLTGGSPLNN